MLALALVGLDRLAGAAALLWTALRLPALLDVHPGIAGLAAELVPVLCFAAHGLRAAPASPDLAGLAWLVVPVVLVATFAPPNGERNPLLLAAVALAALLAVVFAVAMLPTDPRLALAGAVGLSDLRGGLLAMHHDAPALAYLAASAAPVVLAFTVARTRQLRRERPV